MPAAAAMEFVAIKTYDTREGLAFVHMHRACMHVHARVCTCIVPHAPPRNVYEPNALG